LTGLAQINGGAALHWPQRIEHDLRYIREYSLWLDLVILARTAGLVLMGRADTNPVDGDEWGDAAGTGLLAGSSPGQPGQRAVIDLSCNATLFHKAA
jgi:hypothetical protein